MAAMGTALGWLAGGLTTALAVPALTSVSALLQRAAGYGLNQAMGQVMSGLGASAGAGGGTPDWNPEANDFQRRRDSRPPPRRGQRGYRGPGSWHFGTGRNPGIRQRTPAARQLMPGRFAKHHLFPQRSDLAAEFARRGIDIHQFTMLLPQQVHQQLHRGGPRGGRWNQEWENFFRDNPNATQQQVYGHAGALIYKYNLTQPYPIVPYR